MIILSKWGEVCSLGGQAERLCAVFTVFACAFRGERLRKNLSRVRGRALFVPMLGAPLGAVRIGCKIKKGRTPLFQFAGGNANEKNEVHKICLYRFGVHVSCEYRRSCCQC